MYWSCAAAVRRSPKREARATPDRLSELDVGPIGDCETPVTSPSPGAVIAREDRAAPWRRGSRCASGSAGFFGILDVRNRKKRQ